MTTKQRPLSKRQQDVKEFISDYVMKSGFPPTRAEIARGLGIGAVASVDAHLHAMVHKGHLTIKHGTPRGIRIIEPDWTPVVQLGRRAAQEPIPSEGETANGVPSRFARLFRPAADWFVEARDETLRALGAEQGDLIAIRAANTAQDGDVVIVLIRATLACRRVERVDERTVVLTALPVPGKTTPQPIAVEGAELSISGVVVGTVSARPIAKNVFGES